MLLQGRRTEVLRPAIAAVVLGGLLAIGLAPAAQAGGNTCFVPDGEPTIAAALADTNCETISLEPGTYNEDVAINRTVAIDGANENEPPSIIDGLGAQPTVTDADAAAHVWDLRDVTVTGGTDGVGIQQGDTVNLRDVIIEGNAERGLVVGSGSDVTAEHTTITGHTTSLNGAGIAIGSGNVDLVGDSVVSDNETTSTSGGGIHVAGAGSLGVEQSTISGNKANTANLSAGGGIDNFGTVTAIADSSIVGNQTTGTNGFGAGLHLAGTGTVPITNSTIAGNQATAISGGILAQQGADLTHVTVADNTATTPTNAGITAATGGSVNLENSIFADNNDSAGLSNCATQGTGSFITQGNNIDSQTPSGCGFVDGLSADQVGVDPELAPLADQSTETGTLTMAIDDTSPAFNAATDCLPEDQRTAPRSAPSCDVGAYENHECKGQPADTWGTDGDDNELEADDDPNVIVAFGGADQIYGDLGADLICGGDGDDLILGEDGADEIKGEDGEDKIRGLGGKDVLKGDDDADDIKGGDGNDKLKGGDGKDVLKGQGGKDNCNGQGGGDKEKSCE